MLAATASAAAGVVISRERSLAVGLFLAVFDQRERLGRIGISL